MERSPQQISLCVRIQNEAIQVWGTWSRSTENISFTGTDMSQDSQTKGEEKLKYIEASDMENIRQPVQ